MRENFIATFTISRSVLHDDIETGYVGTLDTSWGEIKQAFKDGKNIILRLVWPGTYSAYTVNLRCNGNVYRDGELYSVCFTSHIYPLFGDYERKVIAVLYEDGNEVSLKDFS